ncbi:histidine ammonia-lyase [Haloferax sp. DFSO52]|uniref:histidine ammonia-lyase n=1 Tax=Haloferax sp. DFSO52 TaxID=3388505 RepID=UPI003A836CCC
MSDAAHLADTVVLDGESLTPEDVAAVARHDASVEIDADARERMRESRARVESVLDSGEPVYGVNTGFGHLVETHIDRKDIERLQTNLVRSHSAGAGRALTRSEVRSMMVTRANTLAKGYSGIRPSVVDLLVSMLNEGVHPVVRSRGSLGASGDLAPLAHMALVLIGEGDAHVAGERLSGDAALRSVGLEPVTLKSKEGLALINGTQLTVGLASLFVVDAERIVDAADAAGALTTEVTMGTTANCDPAIHEVRPHRGQQTSAAAIRRLTEGSTVLASHKDCERVQDAYSIRCLPQVNGAVRDAVEHLREAVEVELNSVTDNPLVFPAGTVDERAPGTDVAAVVSAGNFHGEPLALRLDYAAGALTELAAISERRTDRMLNPDVQESYLPPFLTEHSGLRSGYMIAQYTAAALLNECRSFGRPSLDSTPVSGGQEDHVSMSGQSALNARVVAENVATIVGVELLCGAQAAEFLESGLELGTGTGAVRDAVRSVVPPLTDDRPLDGELEEVADLVRFGAIRLAANEATN